MENHSYLSTQSVPAFEIEIEWMMLIYNGYPCLRKRTGDICCTSKWQILIGKLCVIHANARLCHQGKWYCPPRPSCDQSKQLHTIGATGAQSQEILSVMSSRQVCQLWSESEEAQLVALACAARIEQQQRQPCPSWNDESEDSEEEIDDNGDEADNRSDQVLADFGHTRLKELFLDLLAEVLARERIETLSRVWP